ncbi:MAG: hypothetical protein LC114_09165 [Bryobacterales bacterium]|nr:hypothetical protein [Bryobacterales bacterium]
MRKSKRQTATNLPTAEPTLDKKMLLDKLLNVTHDEHDILEWAFATMNESEIESCRMKANEIAAVELRADAHSLLADVLARVMVRTIRWARCRKNLMKRS